jgi:hypothetical protein
MDMVKMLERLYPCKKIHISSTDGKKTFSSVSACRDAFFTLGVFGKTAAVGTVKPTLEAQAAIYEVVVAGKFSELLKSEGNNWWYWQECQVIQFCQEHPGMLCHGNHATFFELGENLLAAVFLSDDGRKGVRTVYSPDNYPQKATPHDRFVFLW